MAAAIGRRLAAADCKLANGKAKLLDVARAAEVSIATASRVLNKRENVGVSARERVLRAIVELGYEPNEQARDLAFRRRPSASFREE